MIKKILVMGLPGSGKTFFSKMLAKELNGFHLNADKVRKKFNDWDFTITGRLRQAKRMRDLANNEFKKKQKLIIADFICPTNETRKIFNPDLLVLMDTIKNGRYQNTNKIFKNPKKSDYIIYKKEDFKLHVIKIYNKIKKYNWKNKKPSILMLGRWQPWHLGHRILFEKAIQKTGQVMIYVKDIHGLGDNPFNFKTVKNKIIKDLKEYKNRFKIGLAPNIVEINYGRTVGYKIKKLKLSKEIEKISATNIRKKLRLQNKLKKIPDNRN